MHSDLIVTIVSAFVVAFALGFAAGRIGLPPIVGYLVAGIVIGPYTPGGSADTELASALAEIGVILLMFGVGLHFSLRELLAVASTAVPGAIVQSTVATALGTAIALTWGWPLEEGIILGLCLSVASTVVLLRALEDRNLVETYSGHVAVGWLVVEDLFTVLILVLLPALTGNGEERNGIVSALAGGSAPLAVLLSLVQSAAFVALMLVVGAKVLPRLLSEVVRTGSRELFTLSILAVSLGVAFSASELFGVSLALGAFLAGIVLNESDVSQRAGLEALPLRDAFAVLFFVSVGMLFEPAVLQEQPLHVIAVVAIVIFGKSAAAFAIVALLGQGVRTGLTAAAALAQVGEFSFILAALGLDLGVLPQEANSLVLAAALISITLNPFVFALVEPAFRLLGGWSGLHRFADRRHAEEEEEIHVRRHVVICGYGRSGSSLARVLSGRSLPFVIIESNPILAEQARAAGLTCVYGDASQALVLEQANTAEARTVAVTFDQQPAAALAVQNAKLINPNVDVVARGSGPGTNGLLRRAGAAEVVDPSLEAALEFVRHVLHRAGISATEISAIQARWRAEYYRS